MPNGKTKGKSGEMSTVLGAQGEQNMLACWVGTDEMRSSLVASGDGSLSFYHDGMKSLDDRVDRERRGVLK